MLTGSNNIFVAPTDMVIAYFDDVMENFSAKLEETLGDIFRGVNEDFEVCFDNSAEAEHETTKAFRLRPLAKVRRRKRSWAWS
jgi:hypothetical protein